MNAFILYLEDGEDGIVKVSAEAIGEPERALNIGEAILISLMSHHGTKMEKRSVFTTLPTNKIQ